MNQNRQRVFLLATGLFWFAMYTYPVLLGSYVTDTLGGAPAMAGLVVGSYGFTQMLLRIPVGVLSDRLRKRKPFLLLGAACATAAAIGLFMADSAVAALLARGMAGVAASTWVCFTVLYGSMQAPEGRAQAMGTLSAYMYAAQLIGTLAGGALARASGARASFALAAAAGLAGLFFATRVTDMPPQGAPVTLAVVWETLKNRTLLGCAALSILLQMIMWSTLYGFSPSWAEQVLGANPAQIGLLSTLHLLPTILFSSIGPSRMALKMGQKAVMMLGFACVALSCFFVAWTTAFWQMLCLQALCGAGVGCAAPLLLAGCTRDIAPEHQGVAMGAYQSLYGIGMFIGPMLAGRLVQIASPVVSGVAQVASGYRVVFLCAAGLALLAVLLTPCLFNRFFRE